MAAGSSLRITLSAAPAAATGEEGETAGRVVSLTALFDGEAAASHGIAAVSLTLDACHLRYAASPDSAQDSVHAAGLARGKGALYLAVAPPLPADVPPAWQATLRLQRPSTAAEPLCTWASPDVAAIVGSVPTTLRAAGVALVTHCHATRRLRLDAAADGAEVAVIDTAGDPALEYLAAAAPTSSATALNDGAPPSTTTTLPLDALLPALARTAASAATTVLPVTIPSDGTPTTVTVPLAR